MVGIREVLSRDEPAQSQHLALKYETVGGAVIVCIEDVIDPLRRHLFICVQVGGQVAGIKWKVDEGILQTQALGEEAVRCVGGFGVEVSTKDDRVISPCLLDKLVALKHLTLPAFGVSLWMGRRVQEIPYIVIN